jgi:transcriptional regulator with XRE-family HTH domain
MDKMIKSKKYRFTRDEANMTLEEVAKALGLSNQMISHIEKKALKKFIVELNVRNIKFDDFLEVL